jgi:methyl acetate hydrolase
MAFDGSAIDRLLTGAVDNGTYEGVVATVVDRDGVLHEGSAGTASLDTMFRNASMTKAVATTAALQLLEQGEIAFDQPVEETCRSSPSFRCSSPTAACVRPRARRRSAS